MRSGTTCGESRLISANVIEPLCRSRPGALGPGWGFCGGPRTLATSFSPTCSLRISAANAAPALAPAAAELPRAAAGLSRTPAQRVAKESRCASASALACSWSAARGSGAAHSVTASSPVRRSRHSSRSASEGLKRSGSRQLSGSFSPSDVRPCRRMDLARGGGRSGGAFLPSPRARTGAAAAGRSITGMSGMFSDSRIARLRSMFARRFASYSFSGTGVSSSLSSLSDASSPFTGSSFAARVPRSAVAPRLGRARPLPAAADFVSAVVSSFLTWPGVALVGFPALRDPRLPFATAAAITSSAASSFTSALTLTGESPPAAARLLTPRGVVSSLRFDPAAATGEAGTDGRDFASLAEGFAAAAAAAAAAAFRGVLRVLRTSTYSWIRAEP